MTAAAQRRSAQPAPCRCGKSSEHNDATAGRSTSTCLCMRTRRGVREAIHLTMFSKKLLSLQKADDASVCLCMVCVCVSVYLYSYSPCCIRQQLV